MCGRYRDDLAPGGVLHGLLGLTGINMSNPGSRCVPIRFSDTGMKRVVLPLDAIAHLPCGLLSLTRVSEFLYYQF